VSKNLWTNKNQDEVISHSGAPLIVHGGPGTGKTTTLIKKTVKLIKDGIEPNSILVLTYGRETASAIRDEIVLQSGATAFEPLVRTFHSLAFSLINTKENLDDPSFVLISGAEQDALIRQLLETDISKSLWPKELQQALSTRGFAREVRDLILRAQEHNLKPSDLASKGKELKEPWWEAAAKFWESYRDVLALASGTVSEASVRVDSSQIITKAIDHLKKRPDLLNNLRGRYKYILVDEFQESAASHRELLDLLASAELTLFVDTDSTIGAFRGADPDGAKKYLKEKNYKSIDLSDKFRGKDLTRNATKLTSAADAANYIAYQFRSAHLKGDIPWSEMAVIVRSPGASVSALARAFALNGIPFEIDANALALNENPAVKPLITVAKIATGKLPLNKSNWPDIEELLRSEYGGIDSISLRQIRLTLSKDRTEEDPKSSIEIILDILDSGISPIPWEQALPLQRISDLIKAARKAAKTKGNIADIFWAIWQAARDYDGRFIQEVWREAALNGGGRGASADRDLDAVIQLFENARRFVERLPDSKPNQFIEQITSESILSDAITAKGVRESVVSILTVHSAKGREWEVVALAGLQEGIWPNYKARGTLLGSERLAEHMLTGLKSRSELEKSLRNALIVDEKRLLFVAQSRAKSSLITVAHSEEDSEPSEFFEEIYYDVNERSSYDDDAIRAPRALTPPAVIAQLREGVEKGDKNSAAVLNLLAEKNFAMANADNWLGAKEISSDESAIAEDKDVRVSPSNLQSFSECGFKWFIERSGGRDGDSTAQLLGTAIHAMAEKLFNDPNFSKADMEIYLKENWKLIDQSKGWIKEHEYRDALEKIDKLWVWHNGNKRKLIAVEADFETKIGRALFIGSVDRVEKDEAGKIYIVDLKSGKEISAKDAAENKQLAGYQLAVLEEAFKDESIRGDVSGSSLVYLGTDNKGAAVRDQGPIDHKVVRQEVAQAAEAMGAKEFIATVNDRCRKCPVKKVCPVQANGRTVLDGN
jgi:superfamily I DNA/RNA helicase/RecB family exonuclease